MKSIKENTVELLHTSEEYWCTGCGACVQGCPTDAITIQYDKKGGPQATVAEDACILCGKCLRACPAVGFANENREEPDCYAVWAEEPVREASSSGGMFAVLATHILAQGGVVFGVAWMEGYRAAHIAIEDVAELPRLQKSKYVRSDTGNTFREAKQYLEQGRTVLYSGVPCQIAGLRNFLGKNYDNLYTVDLLCASAPPPYLFQSWLKENYGENLPKKITFRDKAKGWSSYYASVETEEGIKYLNQDNFPYVRGFLAKTFCPDVCQNCKYHSKQRTGDITLGDFWRIQRYKKELNDRRGTGEVLINNDKGQKLFDEVREQLVLCESVPLKYAVQNKLEPSPYKAPYRDRFYDLYHKHGFNKAYEYCFSRKWDVCLVGCWSNRNYGSCLTYLAMYRILQSMNLEVLMVEQPMNAQRPPHEHNFLQKKLSYHAYDLAEPCPDKRSMSRLNGRADTFIVGSDQLWGMLYERYGEIHTLDFVSNSKKKIAFSTSIGEQHWEENPLLMDKMAFDLQKFDYVSVREKDAVRLCDELLDVEADCTLDPVFLVEDDFYTQLEAEARAELPEAYVGGYFIGSRPEGLAKVELLAGQMGQEWLIVLDPRKSTHKHIQEELDAGKYADHILERIYEEDWITFIRHCNLLVTDSYHAACLAIRFGVPFILKANYAVSRYQTLLAETKLEYRLVQTYEEIEVSEKILDRKEIVEGYERLMPLRQYSMECLKQALTREKEGYATEAEYLWDAIIREQYQNTLLNDRCQELEAKLKEQSDHARDQRIMLHHKIMDLQKARKEDARQQKKVHKEISALQKSVEVMKKESRKNQKAITDLRNSYSWKIGRILTYIPRKIRDFFKRK